MYVSILANNGGIARIDLESVESSITTSTGLDDGSTAAVAGDDSNNILYIGYHDDEGKPISRYDYNNDQWLTSLSDSTHGIPTDPVWWGAMEFASW